MDDDKVEQWMYGSFIIKDGEPGTGEFHKKYDQPYAERLADWQAIEDAKSLDERLDDARQRAYNAVDDCMVGMRNAPDTTLRIEIARGLALSTLIKCRNTDVNWPRLETGCQETLDNLRPVCGPSKTMDDHLKGEVNKLAVAMDKLIRDRIIGKYGMKE